MTKQTVFHQNCAKSNVTYDLRINRY